MWVDSSVLHPPFQCILDVLDWSLQVLFELVLACGGDWGKRWEFIKDVMLCGHCGLKPCMLFAQEHADFQQETYFLGGNDNVLFNAEVCVYSGILFMDNCICGGEPLIIPSSLTEVLKFVSWM